MALDVSDSPALQATEPAPLEACGEPAGAAASQPYCPAQLLGHFALLMAGQGRCVSTAMMLGDREYALWQIGCARTLGDADLAALARRLFAYYA